MKGFDDALILLISALADEEGDTSSMLSSSGLSPRMIAFQSAACSSAQRRENAPGEGGWEGVYLSTMSVHR